MSIDSLAASKTIFFKLLCDFIELECGPNSHEVFFFFFFFQIPEMTTGSVVIGNGGMATNTKMLKENGSLPMMSGVDAELQKSYMLHQAQQNFGGTAVVIGGQQGHQQQLRQSAPGSASRSCLVTVGTQGAAGSSLPYPPSEFADAVPFTQQQQDQQFAVGNPAHRRSFGAGTLPRDAGRRCVEFQATPGGEGEVRMSQTLDKRVKIGGVTTGGILHQPPQQHCQQKPTQGGGATGGPVCSCETDPLLLHSLHLVTQHQQQGKSNLSSGYKDVRV